MANRLSPSREVSSPATPTDRATAASDRESDHIRVYIRSRPLSDREASEDSVAAPAYKLSGLSFAPGSPGVAWSLSDAGDVVDMLESGVGGTRRSWAFDGAFTPYAANAAVYARSAAHVVARAMEGYNGTILAYGQTGSGKTHSMLGTGTDPGIVPRAVFDVFAAVAAAERAGTTTMSARKRFTLRVSYLEVHNEEINDLLVVTSAPGSFGIVSPPAAAAGAFGDVSSRGRNLRILADDPVRGAVVEGLTEEVVTTREQVRGGLCMI